MSYHYLSKINRKCNLFPLERNQELLLASKKLFLQTYLTHCRIVFLSFLISCNNNLSSKVGGLILCSKTLCLVTFETFSFGSAAFSFLAGMLPVSSLCATTASDSLSAPIFFAFLFLLREGLDFSSQSGVLDRDCTSSASPGSSFS